MTDAPNPEPQPTVWMPEGTDPASTEAQSILGAEHARQWLDAERPSVGDAMAEINQKSAEQTRAAVGADWDRAAYLGGYMGQISAAITEALNR